MAKAYQMTDPLRLLPDDLLQVVGQSRHSAAVQHMADLCCRADAETKQLVSENRGYSFRHSRSE